MGGGGGGRVQHFLRSLVGSWGSSAVRVKKLLEESGMYH